MQSSFVNFHLVLGKMRVQHQLAIIIDAIIGSAVLATVFLNFNN
jgi:hypothetical protein